ncbi:hypothetical protein CPPEL_09205 [Corynebacterium pseudopelargi]|uniref:Uncharacterized protein n=1 Tax=Corynebacterium pseudopelargi TaxID=2080757 RepID=A0A3G6J1D1_9CORY|nr:hypothetical protein CPPEL_09205 [Corynebacterium pseudopelargi]
MRPQKGTLHTGALPYPIGSTQPKMLEGFLLFDAHAQLPLAHLEEDGPQTHLPAMVLRS